MAINVFTNVSSLNAQRNLNINSTAQSQTLKRLSSGMRINSASDDAAGLAISNGLTSQIRGFNQAVRNAGDGLSLLGTAEGAMVEQTNILQRMREIAVQAASDSNNSTNRSDLNGEASQLKSELERIARTTSFNGNNLLDGSFQNKDLQVGAMATGNDRINVTFQSTKAADIGSGYKMTGNAVTNVAMTANQLTITTNGASFNVGAATADGVSPAASNPANSALAKANAINAISSQTGVTAQADTTLASGAAQDNTVGGGNIDQADITINGVQLASDVNVGSPNDTDLMTAINAISNQTGVTATLNSSNQLTLNAADGRTINLAFANNGAAISGLGAFAGDNYGKITLSSTNTFSVNTVAGAGMTAGSATQDTSSVQSIDLTSKANAQSAIKIVDTALGQLNSRRAQIGALTNRLNTTINNLNSSSENASASQSRILDADFAEETAKMQRGSILQQAGIAILAQANQGPQAALSLLR